MSSMYVSSCDFLDTRMMRNLQPTIVPEMVRLVRCNHWMLVRKRCLSHPQEVVPSASARSGSGSTLLAMAVRAGAPLITLKALEQTNQEQLGVIHMYHGTVLHEAIQHRSRPEVIEFLLQAMILYQKRHVSDDAHHVLQHCNNLGRTAVHVLVGHVMYLLQGKPADIAQNPELHSWSGILERLIHAYPPALKYMDSDGNTPLLLALLCPSTSQLTESQESYLCRMVQLMVSANPSTASRRDAHDSPVVVGNGAPSPITYALLYGRSPSTIQVLLDASLQQKQHSSINAASSFRNPICSGHHEVPLHLAVTMRYDVSILSQLMIPNYTAVSVGDVYQLTPLDWLWMTHVVDWCGLDNNGEESLGGRVVVSPSTRRYLPPMFLDWHRRVSQEILMKKKKKKHDDGVSWSSVLGLSPMQRRLRQDLWSKACLLLPAAAATCEPPPESNSHMNTAPPWPPLHAACRVKAPLAMIQLALLSNSARTFHAGRLPLHHACARTRPHYYASIPVGASSRPRLCKEPTSPIPLLLSHCPRAVRIRDERHQQLPLHLCIEQQQQQQQYQQQGQYVNDITTLFSYYPESLEQRDGKTMLYPFQQAAVVAGSSLDLVYTLLLEQPTLVSSGIPTTVKS